MKTNQKNSRQEVRGPSDGALETLKAQRDALEEKAYLDGLRQGYQFCLYSSVERIRNAIDKHIPNGLDDCNTNRPFDNSVGCYNFYRFYEGWRDFAAAFLDRYFPEDKSAT